MRPSNVLAIDESPDFASAASSAVSADQVFRASAQLVATGSDTAGSFALQASNDAVFLPVAPTNWKTISSVVSVTGPGAYLVPKIDISYQWLRVIYTSTAPGKQTITTVADVGELNFGIEEFLPVGGPPDGGTLTMDFGGSPVVMLFSDNAATFQTQLQAIPAYATATVSGDFTVGFTISWGIFPDPADGTISSNTLVKGIAPVGINIMTSPGDFLSTLNNTYFLLYSALDANKYAVWFNVSGQGVAPTVPGFTVTEVDINSEDSAGNVAIAMAAVLTALTGFDSSVISGANVSVDCTSVGDFTHAHDSVPAPTGFTFALSASDGVVSVRIKTLGM